MIHYYVYGMAAAAHPLSPIALHALHEPFFAE
jgi:hypothetical protein